MKRSIITGAASLAVLLYWYPSSGFCSRQEVEPTGKGIVGCGLVAAEVVMNIEAVAGVKKAWIIAVSGLVAAGGGAAGGYFLETKPSKSVAAKASIGMLAGGMALFVPTMILVTAMTRYYSGESEGEVEVIEGGEEESSGEKAEREEKGIKSRTEGVAFSFPSAMVNVTKGAVALGFPHLQLTPLYDEGEVELFGLKQGVEYRMNILKWFF